MYPQFSKKFVSPMANRPGAPGPSTTARSPYFTPTKPSALNSASSRRPIDDCVPDSDDEEAPPSIRPDEHDDRSVLDEPVARVKKTGMNSLLPGNRSYGSPVTSSSRSLQLTRTNDSDESYWMVQWLVLSERYSKNVSAESPPFCLLKAETTSE